MGRAARAIGTITFTVIVTAIVSQTAAQAGTSIEASAAKGLLSRINTERRNAELGSLTSWGNPAAEAAKHSADQASRGKISHDGFQGRWDRVRASGSGLQSMCENVAYTQGQTSVQAAVDSLYRLWEQSKVHNECMFDRKQRATWVGIGVKKVGSDTWYATFLAVADTSRSAP